jgi:hypothetical protein
MKTHNAMLGRLLRGGNRTALASMLVGLWLAVLALPLFAASISPAQVPHLVHATELPIPPPWG